jgi:hypothetical protein
VHRRLLRRPRALWETRALTRSGARYFDVDLALSRRFIVREKHTVELRIEAFNIQNRVNFLNPTGATNSTNFGKIQTDIAPRILQLAVKYMF